MRAGISRSERLARKPRLPEGRPGDAPAAVLGTRSEPVTYCSPWVTAWSLGRWSCSWCVGFRLSGRIPDGMR